ncbi:MAG: acetyltransferase-like isoleucine patch superfamily enzyme [Psychromonas sp.]|jgi:acetyltransferase-like isoleucine patch superfamily enzyme|uniref:acyltransferase n=1 Tax=Psychromonas sp. TaxID=1884585 RepID=UPI0039E64CD4
MQMIRKLYEYYYRKQYPIQYAKKIGVNIGKNCRLIDVSFSSEPYLITLGDHVSATSVRFETHDGGVWVFRDEYPEIDKVKTITVGNNVFLGYKSIILPGVTIGDNVVIGAHSVVSKSIPSNSVAAGVPAKIIKDISTYKKNILIGTDNTKKLSDKDKKQYYLKKYMGKND